MNSLNQATSQFLKANREVLAHAIVSRHYGLQPGEWQAYGDSGRQKSIRDTGYHLDYLSEAIADDAPGLFADYSAWVKALFIGLQLPADTLEKTLQSTRSVLHEQLAPDMAALVEDYLTIGLASVQSAPAAPPLFVNESLPLGGLAQEYLAALLHGDRQTASQLILAAVARGVEVKDIYLHVFQRTQYEIGRLWQINRISVAQEHFCTAATQLIMSQLYPHIFQTERVGRRLVATCVGSELHEMGVRMVADFFEMAGWDTYYLGANTPADSILQAVEERRAQVLGISATITFHVSEVAELIARVRAAESGKHIKILVGGYPFKVAENLWRSVNADGFGYDGQQAIAIANELISA